MPALHHGNGDPSTAGLSMVVGALIGIIGACAIAAIALAVLHFKESTEAASNASLGRLKADFTQGAPTGAALPRSTSNTSLRSNKRPGVGGSGGSVPAPITSDSSARFDPRVGGSVGGGGGGKLRHRPQSGLSASAGDLPSGSIFDTQETLDSAAVQEILGSVDENQLRETQALLHSFNWDLTELLHQEFSQGGRGE